MNKIIKIKFKQTKAGVRAYYLQRVGGFPDRWLITGYDAAKLLIAEGKAIEVTNE